MILELEHLRHAYGDHVAIADCTFAVDAGELVTVVGPSGCGKTTMLKAIAGLLPFSGGRISFLGAPIDAVPADLAVVFQDYQRSLYPWLRVGANVGLPLRYRNVDRAERERRVAESLHAVALDGFADRYPWQLSGGMQQRVAIARALAYRPKLLLMDEPFASVDAQTRADLEDLVREVRRTSHVTVVLVTHDIDEAVYLADRVVVLSAAPTRVLREIPIDLPTERDQIATKASERFVALRSEVAVLVRRAPVSESSGSAVE
jgi:NitT/TauT family transport system ATP-binding protein